MRAGLAAKSTMIYILATTRIRARLDRSLKHRVPMRAPVNLRQPARQLAVTSTKTTGSIAAAAEHRYCSIRS
jgi:hypothetical protein